MYKKILFFGLSIVMSSVVGISQVHAEDVSTLHRTPNQMIVDNANMLNNDTKSLVDQQNLQAQNTPLQGQIIMVTVRSTDGESVDDYARELLQQPEWQTFPGKYNVVTLILFAQNNLRNNVRVSTTRNARSLISDDQAVGYLKDNYYDLKSNSLSRINTGLQHVAVSANNAMASGTVAQLRAQQEADRKQAEDEKASEHAMFVSAILVVSLLFGSVIVYGIYIERITKKFNDLFNNSENQQWLKNNKLPENESVLVKDITSKLLDVYSYSNSNEIHYGEEDTPTTQLERILQWLSKSSRFEMLDINKTSVGLTAHRKYIAFKNLAIDLKNVSWQRMGVGYKGSYKGKMMYITEEIHQALQDTSVASLDKLKMFDYDDLEEYYKTFGVQEDYDDVNSLSDDTYAHLFPSKRIYKKYLNDDLPKRNKLNKDSDGSYRYSSSDSDDWILSSILYSEIYPSGSYGSDSNYNSGYSSSSWDSGSSWSGGDSGGFSDGGGGSI